jgi:hypothetical protein
MSQKPTWQRAVFWTASGFDRIWSIDHVWSEREAPLLYEADGTVPIVEWLAKLPRKANAKSQAHLARLEPEGHALRRPVADYLRDGIRELRPFLAGVRYCILHFFHGSEAVVISH